MSAPPSDWSSKPRLISSRHWRRSAPRRKCTTATPFDSVANCRELTSDEKQARNAALEASKKELGPEAERIRQTFITACIEKMVKRGAKRLAAERRPPNAGRREYCSPTLSSISAIIGSATSRCATSSPIRRHTRVNGLPIRSKAPHIRRSSAILRQDKRGVFVRSFAHGLSRRSTGCAMTSHPFKRRSWPSSRRRRCARCVS